MASHCLHVITAAKRDIGILTAHRHLLEAFGRLEETCVERWEEKVDALTQLTWEMRMTKDPLWETKREYVKEWQRNVLITTTSGYHNLVV